MQVSCCTVRLEETISRNISETACPGLWHSTESVGELKSRIPFELQDIILISDPPFDSYHCRPGSHNLHTAH